MNERNSNCSVMFSLQLDHKTEDLNNLRIELEEKRAECLKLKTQLQEMDDKYFDSQAKTKEELGRALRVRTECCDYMKHFWEYCQSISSYV